MSFKIKGWPEGHPHLTKINGWPFGYSRPTSRNPLLEVKPPVAVRKGVLRCYCGKEFAADFDRWRKGKVKHCGECYRDGYASSFNRLYESYKTRAFKEGRKFTLTPSDFHLLTSQPCYYCAAPPSKKVAGKFKNPYIYNGIDRMDSAQGYVLGNVIGCCWKHNDLKGTLSFQAFYEQSLAVVLSVSSRTALDLGDLQCLELLIKLFPQVQFLKEHRLILLEEIRRNPKKLRWDWRLQPVRPEPT
jgi:hypothetical protein